MIKPYIETYENEAGDIVIVYVGEAEPCQSVEPQHIVISPDHIDYLISEMKNHTEQ